MGVKPGSNKNKGQQGPSKYVSSEACELCKTPCAKGRKFLITLKAKGRANCPLCPLK